MFYLCCEQQLVLSSGILVTMGSSPALVGDLGVS
jgi:hypothetical protein